jgi:hypothetical protein
MLGDLAEKNSTHGSFALFTREVVLRLDWAHMTGAEKSLYVPLLCGIQHTALAEQQRKLEDARSDRGTSSGLRAGWFDERNRLDWNRVTDDACTNQHDKPAMGPLLGSFLRLYRTDGDIISRSVLGELSGLDRTSVETALIKLERKRLLLVFPVPSGPCHLYRIFMPPPKVVSTRVHTQGTDARTYAAGGENPEAVEG